MFIQLIQLGKLSKDDEFFKKAIQQAKTAIKLGGTYYNLACLHALLGDKSNALNLLKICLEKKSNSIQDIKKDSDWDSLRSDPDFIALIKEYEDKEKKSK